MIRQDLTDGVLRLVLDRPDKANALTRDMLLTLAEAVEDAWSEGARALVLTGAGRVFSAGADLDAARAGLATDPVWERLSGSVAAFPGLSIAALNGTAAGGSLGMVLACDLRLAVSGAKLFYPVMRLGYLPQPSDTGRLVALVGPARAKALLVAGARIEAEEARLWGLIDRVVAPEGLDAALTDLLQDALAADPTHLAAIKAMVNDAASGRCSPDRS